VKVKNNQQEGLRMKAFQLLTGAVLMLSLSAQAAVVVTPTTLTTTEDGSAVQYQVVLDVAPSAGETVTVTPASDDVTEGTVSGALTFTVGDFDVPQYVTVTPGASGDGNDGNVSYSINHAVSAVGGTASYDGAPASSVSVTNANIDGVASIIVDPSSGFRVTEGGAAQTITISTTSAPAADVTINISTVSTEVTLSAPSVVLNAGNGYNATFTITAVDDAAVDGDLSFTVVTAAATSADGTYAGLDPVDVVGIAADNDVVAAPVAPRTVPAIGPFGLVALMAMLAGLGMTRLGRRKTS